MWDLEQAPFGLGVVGPDKPEALARAVRRYALAGDHLEPPVSPRALLTGVHVATVESDGQWQVRPRQFLPGGLAALDEHGLFGAKLRFTPPGNIQGGPPHRRDVQLLIHRQEVL